MMRPILTHLLVLALGLALGLLWPRLFPPEAIRENEAHDASDDVERDRLRAENGRLRSERDSATAERDSLLSLSGAEAEIVVVYRDRARDRLGHTLGLPPDSLGQRATSYCPGGHVAPMLPGTFAASESCVEDYVAKSEAIPSYELALAAADRALSLSTDAHAAADRALAACEAESVVCEARVRLEHDRAERWRGAAYDLARRSRLDLRAFLLGGHDGQPYVEAGARATLRAGSVDLVLQAGTGSRSPYFVSGGVEIPIF